MRSGQRLPPALLEVYAVIVCAGGFTGIAGTDLIGLIRDAIGEDYWPPPTRQLVAGIVADGVCLACCSAVIIWAVAQLCRGPAGGKPARYPDQPL